MSFADPTPEDIIICSALISELIHTCIRIRTASTFDSYPQWLHTLVLTFQNPDAFSKQLCDITANIPYSYSYIQKQFKHHIGIPPIEFFNAAKLAYAKELLTNTNTSIINVSSALGFESPAHFNHLFKKAFGIAPKQFRKQTSMLNKGSVE